MRSRVQRAARWLLLLLCVGFIIYFFNANREGLSLLLNIRPGEVIALLAMQLVYLLLLSYRQKGVLEKCSGIRIGFRAWFRIFILGRFLNAMMPQSGNVYRSMRLKGEYAVSYTRYVSAYVSSAWMGACLSLLLAAAIIGLLRPQLRLGPIPALYLVLGLGALFGSTPFLVERVVRTIGAGPRSLSWMHGKLSELLQVALENLHDSGYMARFCVATLLIFTQACLVFYLCFSALGIEVGVPEVALFNVLVRLSTYVSLTPGGNIGLLEIAIGLLGEQILLGMGVGILFSLVQRAVSQITLFCLALTMGGPGLLRQVGVYRPDGHGSS